MILCYEEILKYMYDGLINIHPFNIEQLNSNSYDVRLAEHFCDVYWEPDTSKVPRGISVFVKLARFTTITCRLMSLVFGVVQKPVFHKFEKKYGDVVGIPIGGTRLGMTVERVDTVNCVVAQLRSKSSTRRVGITVCDDAGLGDIGYCNHWTVELSAHVEKGYPSLVVGQRFAQVVFYKTMQTDHQYSGQYVANDWPKNMIPRRYR